MWIYGSKTAKEIFNNFCRKENLRNFRKFTKFSELITLPNMHKLNCFLDITGLVLSLVTNI